MREGITEKDDTLPGRLLKEPKPDGPTKGALVPLKELKEDFYKAMGYDSLRAIRQMRFWLSWAFKNEELPACSFPELCSDN